MSVIDGVFSLTLVMNPGLAFGMLAGTPEGWRWMVAALSLGALAVLAVLARPPPPRPAGVWTRLALGLIFGGAVGNLIDRARFGAVVDFLDFYWRDYHWPAFNVADSAITVGVALLALSMLMARPRPVLGGAPGKAGEPAWAPRRRAGTGAPARRRARASTAGSPRACPTCRACA